MTMKTDPAKDNWIRFLDRTGFPLLIARVVLGYVFISMGISKVDDPIAFLKMLREYEMFPDGAFALENFIALTLPWIEVLCGALLIVGVLIRGAALSLLIMLTGFTIVIFLRAVAIYNEGNLNSFCDVAFDCGCGAGPVGMCVKLPENLALWMLCGVPLLSVSRRFCLAGIFKKEDAPGSQGAETSPHVTGNSSPS